MNEKILFASLIILFIVIVVSVPIMAKIAKLEKEIAQGLKQSQRLEKERELIIRATDVNVKMLEVIPVGGVFEFYSSRRYLHVGSIVTMGSYGYGKIIEADHGTFKAKRVL